MALDPKLQDPFDGDEPGGVNLRYETVYDQIKEARTEEEDIPQGDWQHARKTADWPLVVRLCTEVLEKQSKDLQVAVWLTEALLNREGFGGLREGLDLIRGLLERCWDHLYPEIDDGDLEFRAAPLEWLGGYLDIPVRTVPLCEDRYGYLDYRQARDLGYEEEVAEDEKRREVRQLGVRDGKLTPEEFDASFEQTPKSFYKDLAANIEGCLQSLDSLDGVSQDRFGDVAPSFRKLKEAVEEVGKTAGKLLEKKLEREPDPASEAELQPEQEAQEMADGGNAATPTTSAGSTSAPASSGGAPTRLTTREQAAAAVAAAAAFLRSDDPTDPAPYLLLRGLRWGELRRSGDHIDPRLLEAPPTELRTRLKGLLLDARYDELIEAAEAVQASPVGRGWLDLQRYVVSAMDALGGSYEEAAAAVRQALRELLQDRPELATASLMDDSPTANRETLEWLRATEVYDPEGEAPARAPTRPAPPSSAGAASQRAGDLVRAGHHREAIELLMREADQEHSPRARFLRRTEATRIMVENGLEPVAVPILREMLERVERHALEHWEEGEMVAQPMGLLWRCLQVVEPGSGQSEELYKRVCLLDPVAALQLTPGGSAAPSAPAPESDAEGEGGGEG